MPQKFEWCLKQTGHRVRTKKVNKDEYMHICFLDGKSYAGETKQYKKVLKGKK